MLLFPVPTFYFVIHTMRSPTWRQVTVRATGEKDAWLSKRRPTSSMTLQVGLTANELIVVMYGGDCRACVWSCVVYGRKPSKNQKDHREQLLANHKPVEKMAGRRMVRQLPAPNTTA